MRSYRGPNNWNRQEAESDETRYLGPEQIEWLKRDLKAYATKARNAAAMHEELRQELLKILSEHQIAEENHPVAVAQRKGFLRRRIPGGSQ